MSVPRAAFAGWIAALAISPSVFGQNGTPRSYALLIGINEYQASMEGVQNLNFAVNDARGFGELLQNRGYEVIPLRESLVRRETIVRELNYLARTLTEEDFLLVYFAGHGVQARNGANEHIYWLTYDTTLAGLDVSALRLDHVLDYIADIPARRKLVVLDHCHSGKVRIRPGSQNGDARDVGGELFVDGDRNVFPADDFRRRAEARVSEGLVILGAARDRAYENAGVQHGIFTESLMRALNTTEADENDDGRLSLLELMAYLPSRVQALAQAANITQYPVQVIRGQNVDWDLGTVGSDLTELQRLLAMLEFHGSLDPEKGLRCSVAIDRVEQATASGREPDSTELRIVQKLRDILRFGDGMSWTRKAETLEAFLEVALGGNP